MLKKFITEFKQFVADSDFVTVAIGFLVATAVKDLSTSFFTNIVTPILNGFIDLISIRSNGGTVQILGMQFGISEFIAQIFSFFFMLLIAFFFMKAYNIFVKNKIDVNKKNDSVESQEVQLLKEIRDELKKQNKDQ